MTPQTDSDTGRGDREGRPSSPSSPAGPAAEEGRDEPAAGGEDRRPLLLHTKLTVPRVADASAMLIRARLVERVRDAGPERLVVVCAPAGYGKTTLVAQAVAEGNRPVAWVSLDDRDNDPARFVAYLVGALGRASPAIGSSPPQGRDRLGATTPGEALELALNDLANAPAPVTLVLDDYHRIVNPVVHHLVSYLVDFMPSSLRLVLTSRFDPPLPVARMRVRGELLDVRVEDLAFSREETARYLALSSDGRIPAALIRGVHARTEGWIVALRLLSLLIRGEPEERRTAILEGFVGSRRHVAEFLLDEVLRLQSPTRRTFLLHTSILPRLTGALCDAVTEQANGQAVLHALEQEGVPLFALDEQRRWYRYHHLLAELLVQQLTDEIGADGVALLHRRASAWMGEHDLLDEAIEHALAARDWARATGLMRRAGLETKIYSRALDIRGWLEALPAEVRDADPLLTYCYGRALFATGQPGRADAHLERAERAWTAAGTRDMPGNVRMDRAWCAIHLGRTEDALALARESLELNAGASEWFRAGSRHTLGVALARAGRVREAAEVIVQPAGDHPAARSVAIEAGRVLALQGRLAEAAEQFRRGLAGDNPTDLLRRGHIWLAEVYLAWDDLERADGELERAEDLAFLLDAQSYVPSLEVARARLLWAAGDAGTALGELADGIRRMRLAGVESAAQEAEAVRAGFWLAQGRVGEVEAWARRAGFEPDAAPDYARLEGHLVYARVLLAGGQPGVARALLARLRGAAEADGRVVDAARVLVVEALARQVEGDPEGASRALAGAIARLEPGGHLRAFADEGPALGGPLRAVAASGLHLDFVTRLLGQVERPAPPPPAATVGLVDPLSGRELEVLRLVSVGLSNREISDQLFIAVPTVKRHISTILEKLTATSRTQAVSVARSLQLI